MPMIIERKSHSAVHSKPKFGQLLETFKLIKEMKKEHPEKGNFIGETIKHWAYIQLKHPVKAFHIWRFVRSWMKNYHGAQIHLNHSPLSVDASFDKNIPLKEETAINYLSMLSQFAVFARTLASKTTNKEFKHVVDTFIEATQIAGGIFRDCPTTTHLRPPTPNSPTLKLIHLFDGPTNCCPSLHITYLFLKRNLSKRFGIPIDPIADMKVFNAVLSTKQHTHIDVSMGMLLARMVFLRNYPESDFDALQEGTLASAPSNPFIDYTQIRSAYVLGLNILGFSPKDEEYVQYVTSKIKELN